MQRNECDPVLLHHSFHLPAIQPKRACGAGGWLGGARRAARGRGGGGAAAAPASAARLARAPAPRPTSQLRALRAPLQAVSAGAANLTLEPTHSSR